MNNCKYNKDKAATTHIHDTDYMTEQGARYLAWY